MKYALRFASGFSVAAMAAVLGLGCGSGDGTTNTFGQGGGSSSGGLGGSGGAGSGSGQGGAGGEDTIGNGGSSSSGLNEDTACAAQSAEATLTKKPVDIVIVIDNSGSMSQEIAAVERNINDNFASILGGSGLDYRVIIVAGHGKNTSYKICIEEPLSTIPTGGCLTPPAQPGNNPPKFFQYSETVSSHNAWCKLIDTYKRADTLGLAPNGWEEWLRPDAFKAVVVLSDDRSSCTTTASAWAAKKTYNDSNTAAAGATAAADFDADFRAMDPAQFEDADGNRNYKFYSIVGLKENTPVTAAWQPTDPIVTGTCTPGAVNAGLGHQSLSLLTEGLRFPLCNTDSYDAVFQAIAAGVIAGSKVDCAFPIPEAPEGQKVDRDSVVVQYTASGSGTKSDFTQVASAAECVPGAFYMDTETISLCPDTCSTVQADDAAKISVLFACESKIQ